MRERRLFSFTNITRAAAAACFLTLMILYGCGGDDPGGSGDGTPSSSAPQYATSAPAESDGADAQGGGDTSGASSLSLSLTLDAGFISEGIPVLARIEDKDFLSACGEGLARLSIYSASGKELAYEADTYDPDGGSALIWVESPEADGKITLVCSDDAVDGGADGNIWEDWSLVLHMDGGDGALADSSPNGHTVTQPAGSSPAKTDGAVGDALDFDGADDYLTVGDTLTPPVLVNKNEYSDTGYNKPNDWQYAQGLTSDGEYFYFAGHHDKTGEGSSIHKIRISDMTEIAVFEKSGPMHGAELAYAPDRGTLFASTGGEGRAAEVWEMNINDGSVIDRWYFPSTGFGAAAAVAYCGDGEIILFTSVGDGAKFALDRVKLMSGGTYRVLGSWVYTTGEDPGVPQGLEYRDGYVYLLADAGATVKDDPHYIYKLELDPSKSAPAVIEKYLISIAAETEGLFISADGRVYFGTNEERIYMLDAACDKLTAYKEPSPSDGAFSAMCWAYIDGIPNKYPNIMGFGAASGNKNAFALHLMENPEGSLRFGITLGGAWTRFDSPAGSLIEGWNSIAATYDGTVMRLFVNGVPAGELAASGIPAEQGSAFSIGADIENGEPAYFFDGKIDEIRYTRRVLTADEIFLIHNNIASVRQAE